MTEILCNYNAVAFFLILYYHLIMSTHKKLLQRLLSKPKDFSFEELQKLLQFLGYVEKQLGKTSGSRVAFVHEKTKHIIRLHKPHKGNELKMYQINQLIIELEMRGLI